MDADSQDAIKKKIKQYWKIAFPYTFSSNEMREMQVMRTTSQETFAVIQEQEAFYLQNFFKKAHCCIDTMQVLMSDNFVASLLEMSLITVMYWIMKTGQQVAGVLPIKLE